VTDWRSPAHSVWIDTGASAPDHIDPLIEAEKGDASAVLVEFRGATGFSSEAGAAAYDATRLDAYGETFLVGPAGDRQPLGAVSFWDGDPTWAADVEELDGARFLQLRPSLVNDIRPLSRARGHRAGLPGVTLPLDGCSPAGERFPIRPEGA
jgi:hypothetical protein